MTGKAIVPQDSGVATADYQEGSHDHERCYEPDGVGASGAAVLLDDPAFLRELVKRMLQTILEAEMTAHLGVERSERTGEHCGYRNGSKPRTLVTRVGTLELMVPQDREGTFSTELFGVAPIEWRV